MGLEPHGKTCPKTERFWGTGRVVLWLCGGEGVAADSGRAPQGRIMSAAQECIMPTGELKDFFRCFIDAAPYYPAFVCSPAKL